MSQSSSAEIPPTPLPSVRLQRTKRPARRLYFGETSICPLIDERWGVLQHKQLASYLAFSNQLMSCEQQESSNDGKWWGWRGGATAVSPDLLASKVLSDNAKCDTDSILRMPEIEKVHVQQLYDAVASQWHGTRHPAWPRVRAFVEVICWIPLK
jgi:hypothetical protein